MQAILLNPRHLRRRCYDVLKENWKIVVAIIVITFLVVVSRHHVCLLELTTLFAGCHGSGGFGSVSPR